MIKKLLESVATNIVQSEGMNKVIPFQSFLDGEPVSGVLGFQRNAYIVPSDKIKNI